MYKSFADLESGLDFFQTVSKNRHSRNLPFCFLQTGKTLLFIMLKILPAILIHRVLIRFTPGGSDILIYQKRVAMCHPSFTKNIY